MFSLDNFDACLYRQWKHFLRNEQYPKCVCFFCKFNEYRPIETITFVFDANSDLKFTFNEIVCLLRSPNLFHHISIKSQHFSYRLIFDYIYVSQPRMDEREKKITSIDFNEKTIVKPLTIADLLDETSSIYDVCEFCVKNSSKQLNNSNEIDVFFFRLVCFSRLRILFWPLLLCNVYVFALITFNSQYLTVVQVQGKNHSDVADRQLLSYRVCFRVAICWIRRNYRHWICSINEPKISCACSMDSVCFEQNSLGQNFRTQRDEKNKTKSGRFFTTFVFTLFGVVCTPSSADGY